MAERLELTIFDTDTKKDKLVEVVKSLHDRNEWRTDSWWTVVREDEIIPDTYIINQTNGEIGGYNPGRARVVENQIWCRNYADGIALKLKKRKIPYRRGNVETDTSVACGKEVVPFDLDGRVEETYTPK